MPFHGLHGTEIPTFDLNAKTLRCGRFLLYVVCVPKPHQQKSPAIVAGLLEWYSKNARDLPWRRTRDPYAVWVSEIMLQQTQVKTVIPYWERWMHSLPDVRSLAAADLELLHKLWEGLGYYTRVRNMQRAALEIVENHGGVFPRDFEQILALPGIGPYTAGAIGSIAFNQPRPILDGNVARVIARVFAMPGDPRMKPHREKFWRIAGDLVQCAEQYATASHPAACSALNQALMELGALVCSPRNPACTVCPLLRQCQALQTGLVESLPTLVKRPKATPRWFHAFIVRRGGKFLVRQRPAETVNALLWEFPNIETTTADADPAEQTAILLGYPALVEFKTSFTHSITRYKIQVCVYTATAPRGEVEGCQWVSRSRLSELPFSSAHRRIADLAQTLKP